MFKTTTMVPRKDGRLELTKLVRDNVLGGGCVITVGHQKRGKLLTIKRDSIETPYGINTALWATRNGRIFYTPPILMDTYKVQVTNSYVHIW